MFALFKRKKSTQPPPMVVPRIKHKNFLASIESISGITDASRPVTEELAGDLLLTYAVDIGSSYVMVTPSCLREHNLQENELRKLAEANALQAMRGLQVRTDGTVHELTAPDNMGACSMLYPELWQHIAQDVGAPVVAAFPHRDVALYARDNPEGIKAIVEIIQQVDFQDNHALSSLVFRPTSTGWEVVSI